MSISIMDYQNEIKTAQFAVLNISVGKKDCNNARTL